LHTTVLLAGNYLSLIYLAQALGVRKEFALCSNFSCREKSLHEITSWSIFFKLVETLEVRRIGNRKKEPDKTCCSVVSKLVGKILLLQTRDCALVEIALFSKLRSRRNRALVVGELVALKLSLLLKL
jgi:hypothetical protein